MLNRKLKLIDAPGSLNTFPECKMCGECCDIEMIAMTIDEAQSIFEYIETHDIASHEEAKGSCPFKLEDKSCAIYPVRPQTCRLHNCTSPLKHILADHPEIKPYEDKYYVDMKKVFLHKDFIDPRTNKIGNARKEQS